MIYWAVAPWAVNGVERVASVESILSVEAILKMEVNGEGVVAREDAIVLETVLAAAEAIHEAASWEVQVAAEAFPVADKI